MRLIKVVLVLQPRQWSLYTAFPPPSTHTHISGNLFKQALLFFPNTHTTQKREREENGFWGTP